MLLEIDIASEMDKVKWAKITTHLIEKESLPYVGNMVFTVLVGIIMVFPECYQQIDPKVKLHDICCFSSNALLSVVYVSDTTQVIKGAES